MDHVGMDLGKKESQIAIIRCYGPAVPTTPATEGKRPRSVWGLGQHPRGSSADQEHTYLARYYGRNCSRRSVETQ